MVILLNRQGKNIKSNLCLRNNEEKCSIEIIIWKNKCIEKILRQLKKSKNKQKKEEKS